MNKMHKKLQGLFKSHFVKNIAVLTGGTALAQLIVIAALPILTRLYSPEDFEVLAIYTAIISILGVIACLRFEIAIPMPKEDETGARLVGLSLISVISLTLLSTIAIMFFSDQIHQWTGSKLEGYLWWIPAGLLFLGSYNAFQYWATRKKAFPVIARTRIRRSLTGTGAQLGLGFIAGPLGLLIGQIIQNGFGIIPLAKLFYKDIKKLFRSSPSLKFGHTFREYKRFPIYSTWEALANSAGMQIPIIIIATYSIGAEAGFIMLAMRLLSIPMGLIGNSVAQVYLSEAPTYYQRGELKEFTRKTIWTLSKIGIWPLLIAGVSAPFLVPIIFGNEWTRAGILIVWMVPWFFVQFITSPVSMSLHITGNQKIALLLQTLGFLLRGGGVLLAGINFNSYMAEVYAVMSCIFYVVYSRVVLGIISKAIR